MLDYNCYINSQLVTYRCDNGESVENFLYNLWVNGDNGESIRTINRLLRYSLVIWDGINLSISEHGLEFLAYLTQP